MSKIRKSARGRECQIRIPRICNGDPETTVLAHLPGGGMGGKKSDIHAAMSCSSCHAAIDGRETHNKSLPYNSDTLSLWHHEGVIRTQEILLKEGLIKI